MITPIKTVEELRTYIQEITGEVFADKELIWLNCMYQAGVTFDGHSTKDLAEILLKGIPPFNELSDVQELLDMIYRDLDDTTEATLYLQQYVAHFVGNHELATQLLIRFKEYRFNH